MAEKMTTKALSDELASLRTRVRNMEIEFGQKLESVLEKAVDKVKDHLEKARHKGMLLNDTETRYRLIEKAAYLRAEHRGFVEGDPVQDWLEAEIEVNHFLLEDILQNQLVVATTARTSNRWIAEHKPNDRV